MFDSLSDSLRSALKTMRGRGKLSEGNMREGLKLVEQSLLDADVIVALDADLEVAPSWVPRVVEAVDAGADFVSGRRIGRLPSSTARRATRS